MRHRTIALVARRAGAPHKRAAIARAATIEKGERAARSTPRLQEGRSLRASMQDPRHLQWATSGNTGAGGAHGAKGGYQA
eukprot:CAMPEP_0171264508 /NCGR_PEP_ID=MMETSP0790-20130122/57648_1 /TAXON_ID=2925 /ORGANISM="Alexandrium catenella, Strain OF101" /LENGTH=79 /DNA_ID=CAMNT_0011733153 /DNA_START=21 /DNA_END=256 /DNA_ORIENTATION=+